jgi:hypothetical protein
VGEGRGREGGEKEEKFMRNRRRESKLGGRGEGSS